VERRNVSSQVSETRNRSNFAKAGVALLLDQVKDLPPNGISIKPRARMRSLKEFISLMLPSQSCRSLKNRVILKSPIKTKDSDEHQSCMEVLKEERLECSYH